MCIRDSGSTVPRASAALPLSDGDLPALSARLHAIGLEQGAEAARLLLDTLGELLEFYAGADLAFVGGSLVAVGGHNLLEPAALGLPVIAGPHQFNSPDVAWVLAQRGALITVHDAQELSLIHI